MGLQREDIAIHSLKCPINCIVLSVGITHHHVQVSVPRELLNCSNVGPGRSQARYGGVPHCVRRNESRVQARSNNSAFKCLGHPLGMATRGKRVREYSAIGVLRHRALMLKHSCN